MYICKIVDVPMTFHGKERGKGRTGRATYIHRDRVRHFSLLNTYPPRESFQENDMLGLPYIDQALFANKAACREKEWPLSQIHGWRVTYGLAGYDKLPFSIQESISIMR